MNIGVCFGAVLKRVCPGVMFMKCNVSAIRIREKDFRLLKRSENIYSEYIS
jgi:hypothetical protein